LWCVYAGLGVDVGGGDIFLPKALRARGRRARVVAVRIRSVRCTRAPPKRQPARPRAPLALAGHNDRVGEAEAREDACTLDCVLCGWILVPTWNDDHLACLAWAQNNAPSRNLVPAALEEAAPELERQPRHALHRRELVSVVVFRVVVEGTREVDGRVCECACGRSVLVRVRRMCFRGCVRGNN
jgi:hypothetical protein